MAYVVYGITLPRNPINMEYAHTPPKHHPTPLTCRQNLEIKTSQLPLRWLMQKPRSIHLPHHLLCKGLAGLKALYILCNEHNGSNIPFQLIPPYIPPIITKLYEDDIHFLEPTIHSPNSSQPLLWSFNHT